MVFCHPNFPELVGGDNPSEKYWSKWESSRNSGENKQYLKPPSREFQLKVIGMGPEGRVYVNYSMFATDLKHMRVKLDHFPRDLSKNAKHLKPPPHMEASVCFFWHQTLGIKFGMPKPPFSKKL